MHPVLGSPAYFPRVLGASSGRRLLDVKLPDLTSLPKAGVTGDAFYPRETRTVAPLGLLRFKRHEKERARPIG